MLEAEPSDGGGETSDDPDDPPTLPGTSPGVTNSKVEDPDEVESDDPDEESSERIAAGIRQEGNEQQSVILLCIFLQTATQSTCFGYVADKWEY